jgi:hypothetical protein
MDLSYNSHESEKSFIRYLLNHHFTLAIIHKYVRLFHIFVNFVKCIYDQAKNRNNKYNAFMFRMRYIYI